MSELLFLATLETRQPPFVGFSDAGKSRNVFAIKPGGLHQSLDYAGLALDRPGLVLDRRRLVLDHASLLLSPQALLMHGGIEPRHTRMQRFDVDVQVLDRLGPCFNDKATQRFS